MATKPAFEDTLRRSKVALLLSGIKVEDVKFGKFTELIFKTLFYFNFFCLYTDVVAEVFALIEGIQMGQSFVELSLTAPCMTISMLGTVKCIFLFQHEDVIIKVVEKLRNIHPEDVNEDGNDTRNESENFGDTEKQADVTIITNSMKFLNFVNTLLTSSCSAVVIAFSLLPAVSMAYTYFTTGETDIVYPYLTKYFFNHNTKEWWPYVYLHQVCSTAIVGANVVGADTLFYALCLYAEMHFRLLCNRLETCIVGTDETDRKNFKECVTRHQELIELVNVVELLFSKSTLFNIISASVLICLNGFNLTVTNDVTIMIMSTSFLAWNLSQIYFLCFFGDLVMKSSSAVGLAIYKSSWYNANNSTKKSILLVLMRAQKPCKLTACNFADVNLNAFTTILSRSWSYFALLRTMYN